MKSWKLTRFDERYLFNFSAAVWHVLIGISVLAIAGSALIFLWGVVPAFRPRVHKPHYPAPVAVSLEELQAGRNAPAKAAERTRSQEPAASQPHYSEYLASVKRIQELIPATGRHPWRSTGHWERTWYEKRWVVDRVGTADVLAAAFKKAHASNFADKKQLLDSYINTVGLFPNKDRRNALTALVKYTKNSLSESVSNIELLHDAVQHFSRDRTDYLGLLANFGAKNPRDGHAFIDYVNRIIGKFDPELRVNVLRSLIAGYYKHFNNVDQLVEATSMFLTLLHGIDPQSQAKTLTKYYGIYAKKNAARRNAIAQMKVRYEQKMALAKAKYEARKLHKTSYRVTGLLGILSGIGAIAVIALMLVLLAIQRGVRRIEAYHVQQER